MEKSLEEVWDDYERWKLNPESSTIPDVHLIAPMLIPLGPIGRAKAEWLYTCKHLRKDGDCGIYENRPRMCRDFPGEKPCPFPICASHGPRNPVKKMIDWIRT